MIKKSSNIEILRVVAMLMIVIHHYCVHGVFNFWHTNSDLLSYLNSVVVGIFSMGGKLGVDIFVLITGYFMITSNFKLTKALKIYFTMLTYSLLFLGIAYIYGEHRVPSGILNSSLFPFGGNAYWFITTYLMLYIFTPFLNRFILTSKKSMLNSLMIIITCVWVLIPTFTPANYGLSSLTWFIYLYFIGASIRLKTYAGLFSNKKFFKKMAIISFVVMVCYAFIRSTGHEVNLWRVIKIAQMHSLFVVSIAIWMFNSFKDLAIPYNKFYNYIAASMFGVYLIHDNNIVRPFIWQHIFHPANVMNEPYMIFYLLGAAVAVFIFAIVIDKLVMFVFNKPMNKIIEFIDRFVALKWKKCYRFWLKMCKYSKM